MPESRKQRVDRELIELLNELRVVLPGVQVLFAFLLILPFQAGFAEITELERAVYFASLLLAAWFAWFWYVVPLTTPRDPDPAPAARDAEPAAEDARTSAAGE